MSDNVSAQTYYFIAASRKYLMENVPLDETFKERAQNYAARNKEIDYWRIAEPAFLEAPEFSEIKQKCPKPAAAIVSTDANIIRWMKLRLEFVAMGEFVAPSELIPDPLASLSQV
ncbi:Protein of unknown function DUF2488 [Thalassoporum mexicanum PCC 7367]|uniref:MgPME-cyclase complex family protein n=1 Tax=Thalassoporum mexicanum TaxID=3457544 RepID=UPI00029FEA8A|nr:MgPME-cyclase complex family protein [Pseudanabaena sp. PCC 7367]AFY69033.1 Protein of unknown function DUF2488 [Pseudanabaena sp. PCC 7367]